MIFPGSALRPRSSETFLVLDVREYLDANTGQQNFVLRVGDGVADILIEEVVADHADRHLAQLIPARALALPVIADLGLEQVVPRSGRLADHGDVALGEGMQQVDTSQPVTVAVEEAAA